MALVPVLIHVHTSAMKHVCIGYVVDVILANPRTANSGGSHGRFSTMSTFLIQNSVF
jgi:hypothetical protein